MITLIIPACLIYFFPTLGTVYTVLGVISLSLDWHTFYKPKWDEDVSLLREMLDSIHVIDSPQREVLTRVVMDYYKHQLALVQVSSLAWWPATSFRWIFGPESDYRIAAGKMFLHAALFDALNEPHRLHPRARATLREAGLIDRFRF